MASNLRTVNFTRNATIAAIAEVVTAILGFVVRIVFVRCLTAEYLGLGSLFTNILTVLSLAELGAGSAIVFSMYKPLADNDKEKIKSLIALYRKIYLTIGIVILCLGVCLIPFLPFFVNELPDIPYWEFVSIYCLTVLSTSSSYFFSYKYSILNANQEGFIVRLTNIISNIIKSVIQITILLLFHNYIFYLSVAIVITIINNIILSKIAIAKFPYLKEHAEKLDKESLSAIKKNIFALFLYKASAVIATSIDTLLLSRYFGVVIVGIYANYHLVISYSDKLFSSVLGTITPSLGNLMVKETDNKKLEVFKVLQLMYYWVATYLAVGLIVLFNPLIETAFGASYLFNEYMVIALVVSITLTNFQRPCSLTRDATGMFTYGKYRPLFMSLLNIILSIIFICWLGPIGVVLGTALSKMFTYVWYDPYIVNKHAIKFGLYPYFARYLLHWILLGVLSLLCYFLYSVIGIQGIGGLLLGFVYITIIVNGIFLVIFGRTKEFRYLIDLFKGLKSKMFGKNRRIK